MSISFRSVYNIMIILMTGPSGVLSRTRVVCDLCANCDAAQLVIWQVLTWNYMLYYTWLHLLYLHANFSNKHVLRFLFTYTNLVLYKYLYVTVTLEHKISLSCIVQSQRPLRRSYWELVLLLRKSKISKLISRTRLDNQNMN